MNPRELIDTLSVVEKLKCTPRHCYTSSGRIESVAEHSWRLALMALLVSDNFPDADMNKVLQMCLIHDLGEVFTGDIPTFEKTAVDENEEFTRLMNWVSSLPEPFCHSFGALFHEMADRETLEAKIFKALDNMEAVIQHNESDIATWLPLEYDLQLTYGEKNVAFCPYMQQLKAEVNADSLKKIKNSSNS